MDFDTRTAVEKTWREIDDADRANFDPVNSIFSLTKTRKLAGASGWENYVLIFQCTKAKFIPSDPRAALILCYLAQNFNTQEITMRHQFMIAPNCELGAMQGTYDWLEGDWRTAAKRELAKINNNEVNITKHPWALKKMYRTMAMPKHPKEKPRLEGISLILEWQGCEPPSTMQMPEGNYGLLLPDSASNLNAEEPAPVLPPYSYAGNH